MDYIIVSNSKFTRRNIIIDWLYGVQRRLQRYFIYIALTSAPINAFPEFF